jgi:hypothetical protein
MKNALLAILFLATATLCAVVIGQRNRLVAQSTQLTQVQAKLAEVEARMESKSEVIQKAELTERKADILQDALTTTSSEARQNAKQVEQLQQKLASVKTNESGNPFGAMFKDPKMKEMIVAQQKAFMGPMIDKTYASFVQQAGLTPEQTATFKDLLQKKMMVGASMGMSMLDGSLDADKRAELTKQIKSETDGFDSQIKQFLGDDNYQAFQSFEKSVPDRMSVNQFRDQLASSGTPLTPAQESQLVQAMTDTRSSFTFTTDFSNRKAAGEDWASMLNEDSLSKYEQEKAQYDQQVLTKAGQFLSPDQVTALTQFSEAQRNMQMVGMKMAAKMFAPKGQ